MTMKLQAADEIFNKIHLINKADFVRFEVQLIDSIWEHNTRLSN